MQIIQYKGDNMDLSDLIAIKIKELMKHNHLTAYQLEELTGICRSTITLILNRKTKTIRIENLSYICQALNISLAEFFSDKRFEEAEAKDWKK